MFHKSNLYSQALHACGCRVAAVLPHSHGTARTSYCRRLHKYSVYCFLYHPLQSLEEVIKSEVVGVEK